MTSLMARVRDELEESDGGFAIVPLDSGEPVALWREAAQMSPQVGLVPVMAGGLPSEPLPGHLLHRHVLLICPDATACGAAIPWMRALALASPRRHVLAQGGAGLLRPAAMAPSEVDIDHGRPSVAIRIRRAERWLRQGRPRSADRWLAAAAAAATRRGDCGTAGGIAVQRAISLLGEDRVDDAERCLRNALGLPLTWPAYEAAAVVRTDALLAGGHVAHARAWLRSLEAEAQLRGEEASPALRARRAELDFWQGRCLPTRLAARSSASADELGWRGLAAWSRGNGSEVVVAAARLGAVGEAPRTRWWLALLRVILGSGVEAAEVDRRIDALLSHGPPVEGSPRSRRLASAVAARVWLARREAGKAAVLLETTRGPGPEATACARLLTTALVQLGRSPGRSPTPHRLFEPGIEFLASGSMKMHLVDGLSGLLSVVEDSEDDASVLAGGCRWICRQSGAAAVAIVSADGMTMVAAEGWKRGDLAGEIREILEGPARDVRRPDQDGSAGAFGVSIRYGGAAIGSVVARGRSSDRPALQQAATAFAALCGSALRARLDALTAAQRARESVPEIVGDSPLMRAVRDAVMRAASAPFPVLIEGESGTGKELVARAVHRLGPRRDHRLCAVNCAALTDELIEAELFGHTRGAFTGAVNAREGLFEEASGGTLFLDEVTELSPRAQAKLLRVLQEREIRRVGENASRPIDVRVIAACNVSLADAVAGGQFRADLRFRLAVVRIHLPPLRDRVEDIPVLAQQFWRKAAAEAGARASLGPDALARLTKHLWPGNVRELQNVVAGLVVAAPPRGRVAARHVDQVISHASSADDHAGICLETARRTFERKVVAAALVRHDGRRNAAAVELGLTRQGLTKALRRLGLGADEDAAGVA